MIVMLPKLGSKIYLMGVCGTAMASLAGLLQEMGYKVGGSDSQFYPPMSDVLKTLKIKTYEGYDRSNLEDFKPDFVVVGNVIPKVNPEVRYLEDHPEVTYASLPQALNAIVLSQTNSLVVAGTHGKTTTSSLLSYLVSVNSSSYGYLIGGIPKNFGQSFYLNKSPEYFVIEGDEYDTAFFDKRPKFLHYNPKNVILTSIEFDHADIYRDLDHVKESFFQLMELVPKEGHVMACAHYDDVIEVSKKTQGRVLTYGIGMGDYHAEDLDHQPFLTEFDLFYKEEKIDRFVLPLMGEHNVLNSLGAIALAHALKFDMGLIKQKLRDFQGVKRRLEVISEAGGVTVLEDFAHHPTAFSLTVNTVQRNFKDSRVFSIFEPRSASSRRKVFQTLYTEAFRQAHHLSLAKPYNLEGIPEEDRFNMQEVLTELEEEDRDVTLFNSVDGIVEAVTQKVQMGDVILIMSNGGFDGIYQKFIDKLKARQESDVASV